LGGRLRSWGRAGSDDLVEALLPARCRHCGRDVEPGGGRRRGSSGRPRSRLASGKLRRVVLSSWSVALRLLCDPCAAALRPTSGAGPFRDGMTLVSAFEPSPPLFSLLHAFKYEGFQELAPWFGAYLARAVQRRNRAVPAVLLPVPLHWTRLRARGFNQSQLLARQVGMRLGIPLHEDLLRRWRATAPLAGSTDAARWAEVRGAFLRQGPLPHRTLQLLLVDDVVTTGATSAAALEALQAVPERLTVVCVCRARDATTAPEPML